MGLRRTLLVFAMLLFPSLSLAQTSNVTATITDADSQTWNNGTYTISFVQPPNNATAPVWNGTPMTPSQLLYKGSLNSSGVLSVALPDNAFITPSGSLWLFVICPNATAQCGQVSLKVTGASPNLSTTLSNAMPVPRFSALLNAYGYLDVEVTPTPVPGGSYFNVTNQLTRVWNGAAWANQGSGSSGTVNAGTQCETAVYPTSTAAVSSSAIGCDASKFAGVDPSGATDSATGLQNAITAAIAANAELYLPAGTYKTSVALTASSNAFRMHGAGSAVTSITASGTGYNTLIIGPGASATITNNGYLKDIALSGPGITNTSGTSALQINGAIQYLVENVKLDNDDIGLDLINDPYGTVVRNLRAGFSSTVNVGVNLRTGASSGSDLTFENCWVVGKIAAYYAAGGGGGYHIFGGQVGAGQGLGSPVDTSGAVVLGKDYLTGSTGETTMDMHGTSFEGTNFVWAFRSYDQIFLTTYGISVAPQNSGAPAIGFYKGANMKNSRVQINGTSISGFFSAASLTSVAGSFGGVFWWETGTYTGASQPTINGVSTYVQSVAAQSGLQAAGSATVVDNATGDNGWIYNASLETSTVPISLPSGSAGAPAVQLGGVGQGITNVGGRPTVIAGGSAVTSFTGGFLVTQNGGAYCFSSSSAVTGGCNGGISQGGSNIIDVITTAAGTADGQINAATYGHTATIVSSLPAAAAGNKGFVKVVSDSTTVAAEGQTCVGSGTVTALAFSNGTVWKCF